MRSRRQQEPPEESWAFPVPILLHGRSRRGQEDGRLQHRHEANDAQSVRVSP
uniref:Uncharacterized protein n=1 Tax=Arundo donax TaxID=35708 RepID=A0A0A9F5Q8_ARUDO